jgi:N-glycosylase/DNA lyase
LRKSTKWQSKVEIELTGPLDLAKTFDCGQCFRWNPKEGTGGRVHAGTVSGAYVEAEVKGGKLVIESENVDEDFWRRYFDLNRDYAEINARLARSDETLRRAVKAGEGIRILNQEFVETLFTFIISQNSNMPRIKKNVEDLSRRFGRKIAGGHFAFPTPEKLASLDAGSKKDLEELDACRLGYRKDYITGAAKELVRCKGEFEKLVFAGSRRQAPEQEDGARELLTSLPGVGPKVASCVMLFSLGRFSDFPVDVWIKRKMEEFYGLKNKGEIEEFARERFGENAGLAQQYIFYYALNA